MAMQNRHERRLKLLKLEGDGYSQREIQSRLSEEFHVSERTIRRDFKDRAKWQAYNGDAALLTILNRYEQIYQRASFNEKTTKSENARIGWYRVMLDATKQFSEIYVLPGIKRRVEQLKEQIGKGVFICPETLREYSKTSKNR
jgi:transcriptional antiterminator